jgi:hypothetical protein
MSYNFYENLDENGSFGLFHNFGADTLVLLTHGMASSSVNTLSTLISANLVEDDIAFDFISIGGHNAQNFFDYSIESQKKQLAEYFNKYADSYKKIYLVANSYSCLASLDFEHDKLAAKIFVAPSFNVAASWPLSAKKVFNLSDGSKLNVNYDSSVPRAYSEKLEEEGMTYTLDKVQGLLDGIKSLKPVYIIRGSDDIYLDLDYELKYPSNFFESVFDGYGHSLTNPAWAKLVVNDILNIVN